MKTIGKAFIFRKQVSGMEACSVLREGRRNFRDSVSLVRDELLKAAEGNEIFAAHLEILDDPMLTESVESFKSDGFSERESVDKACESICAMFAEIDDEYLRARVDDVRDVCSRIARAMDGCTEGTVNLPDGCVLVAEELLPSDTALLDFSRIRGILCHKGSKTSHVCIIAHSKGVPVNVGVEVSGISDGDEVCVDDPFIAETGAGETAAERIRAAGRKLYCNAGNIEDIRTAISRGADGIGLFRTEFLFLDRDSMPPYGEQLRIYSDAIEACGGKPLTFRTLDIGGDKKIPWLSLPQEENPFLGLRGIRLCLKYPDILRTQLRAMIDAAAAKRSEHPEWFAKGPSPVRIMFPMVDTVEEIREAKALVGESAGSDGFQATVGTDISGLVQFGIMIETPAAILNIDSMAGECNFFSLGTNDLTQYIMAADRGNSEVAYLYDPLCPAMVNAIGMAVRAAHSVGIHTGICGELASDPSAIDTLVSLGLDSFSVSRL